MSSETSPNAAPPSTPDPSKTKPPLTTPKTASRADLKKYAKLQKLKAEKLSNRVDELEKLNAKLTEACESVRTKKKDFADKVRRKMESMREDLKLRNQQLHALKILNFVVDSELKRRRLREARNVFKALKPSRWYSQDDVLLAVTVENSKWCAVRSSHSDENITWTTRVRGDVETVGEFWDRKLRSELRTFEDEMRMASKEAETLKYELEKLKSATSNDDESLATKAFENSKLKDECKSLSAKMRAIKIENSELTDRLKGVQAELDESREEAARLRAETEELEERVAMEMRNASAATDALSESEKRAREETESAERREAEFERRVSELESALESASVRHAEETERLKAEADKRVRAAAEEADKRVRAAAEEAAAAVVDQAPRAQPPDHPQQQQQHAINFVRRSSGGLLSDLSSGGPSSPRAGLFAHTEQLREAFREERNSLLDEIDTLRTSLDESAFENAQLAELVRDLKGKTETYESAQRRRREVTKDKPTDYDISDELTFLKNLILSYECERDLTKKDTLRKAWFKALALTDDEISKVNSAINGNATKKTTAAAWFFKE